MPKRRGNLNALQCLAMLCSCLALEHDKPWPWRRVCGSWIEVHRLGAHSIELGTPTLLGAKTSVEPSRLVSIQDSGEIVMSWTRLGGSANI